MLARYCHLSHYYLTHNRTELGMSQAELAQKARMHLQSIGKIESGKTTRLNSKSSAGLSKALQVLEEYLDAACKGIPITAVQQLKICPRCWTPGTEAEAMWLHPHSKFCFACGTDSDRCRSCNEAIVSLKFRFCPYCGTTYKVTK
ncbi:double zinc ribbon domain-containing protein [Gloeocapsopsis dulcis]|nr:zinc ribbon domain-containing protein [Gloeocapsopsis dulcis]WNN92115.1 zinc ribbon domain-containing protein [Gloeocapsopsis dulcis]